MKTGVPLVAFMYLAFTHIPGESYRRRLRSLLLCLCDVFRRALIADSRACVLIENGCSTAERTLECATLCDSHLIREGQEKKSLV